MRVIFLGCGYLGYNLYTQLKDGFDVEMWGIDSPYSSLLSHITYVDVYDPYSFSKLDLKDAIIIDTVSYVASTDARKNEEEILDELKTSFENLLGALKNGGIKRYLFFSSGGTVYGSCKETIKETNPLQPNSLYAKTKVMMEEVLQQSGIDYLICRISNPYGGYQVAGKKQGVIPIMIRAALEEETFYLYTDASNVRDYFYIDDFAKAIQLLLEKDISNEIVNIGSGIPISLQELLEIVEKVTKKKIHVEHKESDVYVVEKNVLDISKLKALTGFEPSITLEEGIHREVYRIKEDLK